MNQKPKILNSLTIEIGQLYHPPIMYWYFCQILSMMFVQYIHKMKCSSCFYFFPLVFTKRTVEVTCVSVEHWRITVKMHTDRVIVFQVFLYVICFLFEFASNSKSQFLFRNKWPRNLCVMISNYYSKKNDLSQEPWSFTCEVLPE